MKLCGEGFMIANEKNDDGSWDWRTFGTGEGFTADLIVTGFLSADRIQAHSITANHLALDVGQSLDLSSNKTINLTVETIVDKAVGYHVEMYCPIMSLQQRFAPAFGKAALTSRIASTPAASTGRDRAAMKPRIGCGTLHIQV